MPSQLIACPQCQAPLSLTQGRRFCQCPYCGSKLAIQLLDGRPPRLARLESVLSATAGQTLSGHVEQRLADLELTVADAEDDVECKQAELADRKAAYWRTRVNLQRLVAPVQNTTYIAGLLAAVATFAALFVFKRPDRLAGALIAILIAVAARGLHQEWQEMELQGQGECEEAKADLQEAEGELRDALAGLEDKTLEREFLQSRVLASKGSQVASAT